MKPICQDCAYQRQLWQTGAPIEYPITCSHLTLADEEPTGYDPYNHMPHDIRELLRKRDQVVRAVILDPEFHRRLIDATFGRIISTR